MKTAVLTLLFLNVFSLLSLGNENVKLALHVKPKVLTRPVDVCAEAPQDLPCSQYETRGSFNIPYDVYLVAGNGDPSIGIASISTGIDYNGGSGGLLIADWVICAGYSFESGPWPEPNTSILAGWTLPGNCQSQLIPGAPLEGVHAIAGAFYVYAYGADTLRFVPGEYGPIQIGGCDGSFADLSAASTGSIVFSNQASSKGANPCAPVSSRHSSWGRIKSLYRRISSLYSR